MARAARKEAAIKAAQSGEQMTHRQIILVLIGLMSGMFLSALDQSVVGSAMRTIADDLKGLELQAWVTTAYLITSTIATPIYGKLGDIFGRRKMFILGLALFGGASFIVGVSSTATMMITARVLQGAAAAILAPSTLALLSTSFPVQPARGRALAIYGSITGIGTTLGLVLGGWIAGAFDWRWAFLHCACRPSIWRLPRWASTPPCGWSCATRNG